jgi:hypothetical protein
MKSAWITIFLKKLTKIIKPYSPYRQNDLDNGRIRLPANSYDPLHKFRDVGENYLHITVKKLRYARFKANLFSEVIHARRTYTNSLQRWSVFYSWTSHVLIKANFTTVKSMRWPVRAGSITVIVAGELRSLHKRYAYQSRPITLLPLTGHRLVCG